jgi:hypothetical protein
VCVCEKKRFDFTDLPEKKCDEQDCQATRAQAKVVPVWPIGDQVYSEGRVYECLLAD